MSHYQDYPEKEERRGGGFLGKLLALLLGFILGVASTIGGIAGLGYYVVAKITIKDAVGKVNQIAGTNVDPLDYLNEEYAEKTVLGLFQDILPLLKEESANKTLSLNTFAQISPKVHTTAASLVSKLEGYGVDISVDELMAVPFSSFGTYLGDTVKQIRLDTVLTAVNALDTSNAIIRALIYGTEGKDYVMEDGKVEMLPLTYSIDGDTITAPDGKTYTLQEGKYVASDGSYIQIPATGSVAATFNSEGLRNDTPDMIVYDQSGNVLYHLYVDTANTLAVYKDGVEQFHSPLKIGDLMGNLNMMTIFEGVRLGDLMQKESLLSNNVLLALCYGVQGEDFEIVNGNIQPIEGGNPPTTVGELMGGNTDDLLDKLEIGALLNVKAGDAVMCALAYGTKNKHYKVVDGEIQMLEIFYTAENGVLYDENGNEIENAIDGEAFGIPGVFRFESDGTTLYARHDGDLNANEYRVYENATDLIPQALKHKKKTIAALLKGSDQLLNGIELGAVMNLNASSDPIMLSIAYESYEIVNGELKTQGARTLADLQGDNANELLNTIELGTVLKVSPTDDLMCSLAYGTKGVHYDVMGEGASAKVYMMPVVYTVDDEGNLYDENGALVEDAVLNGSIYTLQRNGKTVYSHQYMGNLYYLYEVADCSSGLIRYEARTIASLRNGDTNALLAGIQLASVLKIDRNNPNTDPILLSIAYATNEDGSVNYNKPRTLADLQGDNANELLQSIQLGTVLKVSATDDLMCSLAYGTKGVHYTVVNGVVNMLPVTYTLDGDNLVNEKGETVDATVYGNGYTFTLDGEIRYAFPIGNNKYEVYETSTATGGKKVYHKPRTIADLRGGDTNALLAGIQLATVLKIDPNNPNTDPILLAIAYDTDENGNVDYDAPRTLADLQGDNANELLQTIKLGTVLKVKATDELLCSIAYGTKGVHYEVVDGVVEMLPLVYTLDGENLVDQNGNTYAAAAENGGYRFLFNGETRYAYQNQDGNYYIYKTASATEEEKIYHEARSIADLRSGNTNDLIAGIPLETVLKIDPEKLDSTDPILLAIAYGTNEDGSVNVADRKTVADLQGDKANTLFNGIELASVLKLNASSDPILLSIAYESYTITENADGTKTLNGQGAKTIGDLRGEEANELFNNIELATVLGITASSDEILISIAYESYTITENEDGTKTLSASGPRKLSDLRGENAGTLFNNIKLATVLKLDDKSDAILKAIAYGKDDQGNTYNRTIADLQGENSTALFNSLELGNILNLNGSSDAILLSLAYGKKDVDYTVGTDGAIVPKEGGKAPTTLNDLRGNNASSLFNSIELATVLKLDDKSDAILKAIAYGKDDQGNTYNRTIADLQGENSTALFNSLELGNILNLNGSSDALLLQLAYGKKDVDYTVKADGSIEPKEGGKAPVTLADLRGNNASDVFNSIELATVLKIDDSSDAILKAIAYGKDDQGNTYNRTIKDLQGSDAQKVFNGIELATILSLDASSDPILLSIAYESFTITDNGDGTKTLEGKNPKTLETLRNPTESQALFNNLKLATVLGLDAAENPDPLLTSISYDKNGKAWTIGDLRGGNKEIFNNVKLGEVLGLDKKTADTDAILLALAYGKEGVDYTVKADGTIVPVSEPTTIEDLRSGDVLKGIELSSFISFDKTDKITSYILYGVENAHFYVDGNGKPQMLEKRIALDLTRTDAVVAFDVCGNAVTVVKQADGSYTYKENDVTYTVDVSAAYSGNGLQTNVYTYEKTVDGETVKEQRTIPYYLLKTAENQTELYKARTIGDLSSTNSPVKSITSDLRIGDFMSGTSDAILMQTIASWKISDLQKQENIDGILLKQVISIDEDSPHILRTLGNSTIGGLPAILNDLKVKDILDDKDLEDKNNRFITLLADVSVVHVSAEIAKLTVQEIYYDEIYQKIEDGNTDTTYYINTSWTESDGVSKNVSENIYYYEYEQDGVLSHKYYVKPLADLAAELGVEQTAIHTASGAAAYEFKPVLQGTWKLLLGNPNTEAHEEQLYTIGDMPKLVENMTGNINRMSLLELDEDLGLELGDDFKDLALDDNVIEKVGRPKDRLYVAKYDALKAKDQDATLTFCSLTLKEIAEYVPDLKTYYQMIFDAIESRYPTIDLDSLVGTMEVTP